MILILKRENLKCASLIKLDYMICKWKYDFDINFLGILMRKTIHVTIILAVTFSCGMFVVKYISQNFT